MYYIVFDYHGDTSKTFIGKLDQCVDYIQDVYGGLGYEYAYVMYEISGELGFSTYELVHENFINCRPVNVYEELDNALPNCMLCGLSYKSGSKRYCVRCLESYNNGFCNNCGECVTTNITESMWYNPGEIIYCINCQVDS